jgi:hypothetical protein
MRTYAEWRALADEAARERRTEPLTGAEFKEWYAAGERNLTGADFYRADFYRADFYRANLTGANLTGANLTDADLTDANLTGANLTDANLTGANFYRANLTGANLTDANLTGAYQDFIQKCMARPAELVGLRAALVEGRVSGTCYEGECACFVGTLANVAGVHYTRLEGIVPNSGSPIERLFFAISEGDTPETNVVSRLVVGWLDNLLDFARAFPKADAVASE